METTGNNICLVLWPRLKDIGGAGGGEQARGGTGEDYYVCTKARTDRRKGNIFLCASCVQIAQRSKSHTRTHTLTHTHFETVCVKHPVKILTGRLKMKGPGLKQETDIRPAWRAARWRTTNTATGFVQSSRELPSGWLGESVVASKDRVRLLSSTLLSISWVAIVAGSSPGGGLILCFLFLSDTGDTDWLRRPLCSPGLGERCLPLCAELGGSCVFECVWTELFIRLTSSSASSNWGLGSEPRPGLATLELQSGAGVADSPLGTIRLDRLCWLTGLFSASVSGWEPQMVCSATCSCPVDSLWLRLWLLHEMTLWGCVYFSVCTLDDRWRGGVEEAAGTVRWGSARSSAEPLWSRESQRTASCRHTTGTNRRWNNAVSCAS